MWPFNRKKGRFAIYIEISTSGKPVRHFDSSWPDRHAANDRVEKLLARGVLRRQISIEEEGGS